jgi:large subunit ribosomal protein L9
MKVLLLKDVYKLGRAGDVKKVADGYGRNYLLTQGLAVLATAGAIKQAESIRGRATQQREVLNKEMGGTAERLTGLVIGFPVRAGDNGKLYGSITTQMIAEEISRKAGTTVERRQIECQPIRTLGDHKCLVRLTVDLTPEVRVIVHREGETPAALIAQAEAASAPEAEVQPVVEEPVTASDAGEGAETAA